MKRFFLSTLLLFLGLGVMAQNPAKLSNELQEELSKRTASNEQFRITIIMAEEYDQDLMAQQIKRLDKKNRRAFVIEELQRFAEGSQASLMLTLQEGVKKGTVKALNSFWIFNGISCVTNRETIAALSERQDIAFIESDEIRNMLPEEEQPVVESEPKRGLAWHISQVHADQVWTYNGASGYDGTGVVVAILDTGVNYEHTDVADHMWDGGEQYPLHGWDFINDDNDPMDDQGHGSHCAGITAGDGTSGTQTGIAPNATVMALKVLGADGSGTSNVIQNAMQFAMENGADVVSMSLGGSGQSGHPAYRQVFVNMMNAGIVAAVAAGNDGESYSSNHTTVNSQNQTVYYAVPTNIGSPGNCPPPWHNPDQTLTGGNSAVVTVGASNRNDRKATFSSFGPVTWDGVTGYDDYPYQAGSYTDIGLIKPDIIAPGTDITSLLYSSNTSYVEKCGTSMATPGVAGIMALMLQADHNLTPAQIDEILETTALPVDYRTTKNNYTGAGRVDALAAIDAIITQATQPTNLSLTTCGGNVNLSWTASTAPAGYCIYRDNEQVGTTNAVTFTDENVGAGQHVYYVRANDNNGHQSVHSNAVLCTIQPYATVPDNLTLNWDGTTADLKWDASTVSNTLSETTLYINDNPYTAFGTSANTTMYWGICFNPEELRPCQGMSIDRVSIPIYTTGISYTLRIYRGTEFGNTTGTPVYTQSFTPTSGNFAYNTMTLTTPYALTDITQDLWLTFSATMGSSMGYPAVFGLYEGHNSNCLYLGDGASIDDMCWKHLPDYGNYNFAFCIKAHLTRTTTYTPSYNVYLNNASETGDLSVTTYADTPVLQSGDNTYQVTAKVGDNESCPSNEATVVFVDGSSILDNLTLNEQLSYEIAPTGILTVNDQLSADADNRLFIEEGGQLIASNNVEGTMQKGVVKYTGEKDSYYLIASPVVEEDYLPADLTTGTYDLYLFDQSSQQEWRNYKAEPFYLENGKGYLYANADNNTFAFTGTLNNTNGTVDVDYDKAATFKGFNLIGNPFPCNAYLPAGMSYYRINGEVLAAVTDDSPIAPLEGVFVEVDEAGTVEFSKDEPVAAYHPINIEVTSDDGFVDRAALRFDEGGLLHKFQLNTNTTKLYIPQGGQEYAVVRSNGQGEMPINFKASKNGTYTISVSTEMEMAYLHLIDNMTGADIDLLPLCKEGWGDSQPAYTFQSKTSDYASRFKLVFASVCEDADDDNETFAYYDGNVWNVSNKGEATVQIVDMLGRIVKSETIHGNATMSTANLGAGVYVMRLINGENVMTQKIVVR